MIPGHFPTLLDSTSKTTGNVSNAVIGRKIEIVDNSPLAKKENDIKERVLCILNVKYYDFGYLHYELIQLRHSKYTFINKYYYENEAYIPQSYHHAII
jgi:hypothetical protein